MNLFISSSPPPLDLTVSEVWVETRRSLLLCAGFFTIERLKQRHALNSTLLTPINFQEQTCYVWDWQLVWHLWDGAVDGNFHRFHNIQSHFWTVELLCNETEQAYIIIHLYYGSWCLMCKCTVEQQQPHKTLHSNHQLYTFHCALLTGLIFCIKSCNVWARYGQFCSLFQLSED